MSPARPVRVAVYSDHWYRRLPDGLYADRALVIFLAAVAAGLERMVLLGQLDPQLPRAHYRVPDGVEFRALPSYPSLLSPGAVPAMLRSLRRFWRVLDDVDGVWLLGPHPLGLAFALLAGLRRRRVALGVRQDFPVYVRTRHPGRRGVQALAELLERAWRLLARRCPTVVVGPGIARNYSHAGRLLETTISLVPERELADPAQAGAGELEGELPLLTVTRLETEKNPLMLADVMARLPRRWRLTVCGEGPLEEALRDRAAELGVSDRIELVGYLPNDGGLLERYRSAAAFLHVSWTEGVPQVLLEALGQGLPVVATDVGGVRRMAEGAALLIAPGDPQAAADALERLASDAGLRRRLGEAGLALARAHTLEAESERVAAFLAAGLGRR